jgi:predicted nucleic acid-binding protein
MTRYLLDSNHLGPAIRRVSLLPQRIEARHRLGDRIGTSVLVLYEIEAGLRHMESPHGHRHRLGNLMTVVRLWPTNESLTESFGEISALARRRGRSLSFVDLVLAAMALQLNAVLLTTDTDFDAFPEVHTENWMTL